MTPTGVRRGGSSRESVEKIEKYQIIYTVDIL